MNNVQIMFVNWIVLTHGEALYFAGRYNVQYTSGEARLQDSYRNFSRENIVLLSIPASYILLH